MVVIALQIKGNSQIICWSNFKHFQTWHSCEQPYRSIIYYLSSYLVVIQSKVTLRQLRIKACLGNHWKKLWTVLLPLLLHQHKHIFHTMGSFYLNSAHRTVTMYCQALYWTFRNTMSVSLCMFPCLAIIRQSTLEN